MYDVMTFISPNNAQDLSSMGHTMWWGYRHQNGTNQLKRWFGDHMDYTGDCQDNPFVVKIVRPFASSDSTVAHQYLCDQLNKA